MNIFERIFGKKKKKETPFKPTVRTTYPESGYQRPVDNDEYKSNDDFLTSMIVAQATDNTMLGYMAGGNLTGAMLGDAMNTSNDENTNQQPEITKDEPYSPPEPDNNYSDSTYESDSTSYDSPSNND